MRHTLPQGEIVCAKAEDVYSTLDPGSYEMAHIDGPYAVGKAGWDKMKLSALADWYAPHIDAWGRLLAPSASIYHWGNAASWAAVNGAYLERGWAFRGLITWDKGIGFLAGKIDTARMRMWPDTTEICAFYQREGVPDTRGPAQHISQAAGASEGNEIRRWLHQERLRAALPLVTLKQRMLEVGGAGEMIVRHSFYESQWCMPTWEQWRLLHQIWNEMAGGPYLQRNCRDGLYEYEALRAEYEALRAPFALPIGLTNVWRENQVQGRARLRGTDNRPLHPCQKPNVFAERMVLASTRPGGKVLEPFGGTCRIAYAIETLAARDPVLARRYTCIEMDARYVDAIVAQLARELPRVQEAA